MAAGDTFRAGAIDQLKIWADRVGCECTTNRKEVTQHRSCMKLFNKLKTKY